MFDRIKFKQATEKYCETMGYHDMDLTEAELVHLSGYMGSTTVTPEARAENIIDKFHFEIKRGLARRYSFELLLRRDGTSYQEFIQAQNKSFPLSLDVFNRLSAEARSLNDDLKVSIKISCLLTINETIKQPLKENGYVLSNDSEEFLSQLMPVLSKNNSLLSLTKPLTAIQLNLLQKMFWPTMHFRHMLYTEGGDNMSKSFSDGVLTGEFDKQAFLAWKWRWLTNLFGFQGDKGAKYYDAQTHFLAETVIIELEKILDDPAYSYLDNYLLKRAKLAGFNDGLNLSKAEQQLLGHLAAYFNQVNVLSADTGKMIYAGYLEFNKEFDSQGKLAALYEAQRKDRTAVTPTYVPAIINTAYLVFKNKFNMDEAEALKNASQFMCQLLLELYALPHNKRISCMNLAKETNLHEILEKWLSNHHSFVFKLNENFDLVTQESVKFRKSF